MKTLLIDTTRRRVTVTKKGPVSRCEAQIVKQHVCVRDSVFMNTYTPGLYGMHLAGLPCRKVEYGRISSHKRWALWSMINSVPRPEA